jgi:hypothetical protein
MARSPAQPIIISGADRHFFAMGCLLMRSLERWAPQLPRYLLDFGLDEPQRRFFRERGVLIERPANVPADLHPIVAKTAIGAYLRDVDWSALLWLDSDMLAVGPLQQSLADVLAEMEASQSEVAACSVETIRELFAGGWPMAPFAEALRNEGIDLESPYYNNAAVVFRSVEFVDEWWRLAQHTPLHLCIDQNLFTLLALRRRKITPLSARVWNLHGPLLAQAKAVTDGGEPRIVSGREAPESALILHPTSIRDQHHLPCTCTVGQGPKQALKLFRNPDLRERQIQLISELIAEDRAALARAGMDRPDALLQAAYDRFPRGGGVRDPRDPQSWGKVGRLEPCPCGSGKRYKHCHGQYA